MIYLGTDHAGWQLKQEMKGVLEELGLEFQDLGAINLDPDDDYPDYAFKVAEAVVADLGSFGVLFCGSAQGVCIAANKVRGARAVTASSPEDAAKTREHNDANVLCLSGWHQDAAELGEIITTFVNTPFSGEVRHARRLAKITAYESK
jgi:ribose 5-phosphate isomerase B